MSIGEKLIELYNKGFTNKEMAVEFGVKPDTIVRWKRELRKLGVDIPKKVGRPKKKLL